MKHGLSRVAAELERLAAKVRKIGAQQLARENKQFHQGFGCAVSSLLESHGRDVAVEELYKQFDPSQCDTYDKQVFKKHKFKIGKKKATK